MGESKAEQAPQHRSVSDLSTSESVLKDASAELRVSKHQIFNWLKGNWLTKPNQQVTIINHAYSLLIVLLYADIFAVALQLKSWLVLSAIPLAIAACSLFRPFAAIPSSSSQLLFLIALALDISFSILRLDIGGAIALSAISAIYSAQKIQIQSTVDAFFKELLTNNRLWHEALDKGLLRVTTENSDSSTNTTQCNAENLISGPVPLIKTSEKPGMKAEPKETAYSVDSQTDKSIVNHAASPIRAKNQAVTSQPVSILPGHNSVKQNDARFAHAAATSHSLEQNGESTDDIIVATGFSENKLVTAAEPQNNSTEKPSVVSGAADDTTRLSKKIEDKSMKLVIAFEKTQERAAKDVSMFYVGYDLKSQGANELRLIEVKGKGSTGAVIITANEWRTAIDLKHNYFLYIVDNVLKRESELKVIRNPGHKLTVRPKTYQYSIARNSYIQKATRINVSNQ